MSSIAIKFTSLVVRTLSKPIANGIKSQAKQHPRFRQACISFAQFMHRSDVHLRMKLLGEDHIKVRPLNDVKAIDNGATFLSESFIFSVAGGLILFESYRSHKKEVARREGVADDIKALQDEIEWLKNALKEKDIVKDDYRLPNNVKPTILKQLEAKQTDSDAIKVLKDSTPKIMVATENAPNTAAVTGLATKTTTLEPNK